LARLNQTTNEHKDDPAERHLTSTHEVFPVGGVWKEIKLTARRKRPDEFFGRDRRKLAFEPHDNAFQVDGLGEINLPWRAVLISVGLMGIFNVSQELNRCFNSFYIRFTIKWDAMGGIEKI